MIIKRSRGKLPPKTTSSSSSNAIKRDNEILSQSSHLSSNKSESELFLGLLNGLPSYARTKNASCRQKRVISNTQQQSYMTSRTAQSWNACEKLVDGQATAEGKQHLNRCRKQWLTQITYRLAIWLNNDRANRQSSFSSRFLDPPHPIALIQHSNDLEACSTACASRQADHFSRLVDPRRAFDLGPAWIRSLPNEIRRQRTIICYIRSWIAFCFGFAALIFDAFD